MGTEINMSDKKQKVTLVVIILLLLFSVGMLHKKMASKNVEINMFKQNQKALKDSIRISKNKINDVVFSKNILVTKKNELQDLNSDLNDELKKERGKVYSLNKTILELRNRPPKVITNTVYLYPDNVVGVKFEFDTIYSENNRRKLVGETKFKIKDSVSVVNVKTDIIEDLFNFDLITGLKKKDGNLEIFIRSNYPNLNVTNIEGAIINPQDHPAVKEFTKQKKWSIGPHFGYGITNKGLSPTIGISLQYGIIRF